MTWILGNWKLGLAVIATLALASGVEYIRVTWLEMSYERQLREQKEQNQEACQKAQKTTETFYANLQKDRDTIAAKLASLKLHPRTVVVYTSDASRAASSGVGTTGSNASITDTQLYDFTAENCSRYRSERIELEKFIQDERTL